MKKLILVGILVLTLGTSIGIAGVPCAVLPAPVGWSMIANPCDGGVTTVDVFLPTAPNETMLYKFTGTTWDFEEYVAGVGWIPGLMTLSPGEGVLINLPAPAALGFEGVALVSPQAIALPAGFSMRSAPAGLGMAGFPAAEGDMIFKFNPPTNTYDLYTYVLGAWDPAEPVFAVGEAFWVLKTVPAVWGQ